MACSSGEVCQGGMCQRLCSKPSHCQDLGWICEDEVCVSPCGRGLSEVCNGGVDEDCDGATDCHDIDDCANAPECLPDDSCGGCPSQQLCVREDTAFTCQERSDVRLAFLTAGRFSADFGAHPDAQGATGAAAADAICTAAARSAGLMGREYVAFLSTSTESARDRFSYNHPGLLIMPLGGFDYQRVDTALYDETTPYDALIHDFCDSPKQPIVRDEHGTEHACDDTCATDGVWTGSGCNGTAIPAGDPTGFCDDWTSASSTATAHFVGDFDSTTGSWAQGCVDSVACSEMRRLYCFQMRDISPPE